MLPLGVGEVQQRPLPHLRSTAQLYTTELQHIAFKQHSSVCLAEFLSVLSPPLFFFLQENRFGLIVHGQEQLLPFPGPLLFCFTHTSFSFPSLANKQYINCSQP